MRYSGWPPYPEYPLRHVLLAAVVLSACRGGSPARDAAAAAPPDTGPAVPQRVASSGPSPGGNAYSAVAFTPDGRTLLAEEEVVEIFDFDPGTGAIRSRGWLGFVPDRSQPPGGGLQAQLRWAEDREAISTFAVSPDGRHVVAGGRRSGRIGVWALGQTGEPAARQVGVAEGILRDLAFVAVAPGGKHVLAGGRPAAGEGDGEGSVVRLLAFTPGAPHPLRVVASLPMKGELAEAAVSPDGRLAVVIGSNRFFRLLALDGDRMTEAFALEMDDTLEDVRFTPDGKALVTGGFDQDVRVWAVEPSGITLRHVLRHHRTKVRAVAVAPDGRWVAASSPDKEISLWPLAGLRDDAMPAPIAFQPSDDYTYGMAVHPQGPWLVTTGRELQVWRLNRNLLASGKGSTPRRTRAQGTLPWTGPPALAAEWRGQELLTVDGAGAVVAWGGAPTHAPRVVRAGLPLPAEGWPPVSGAVFVGDRAWLGGADGALTLVPLDGGAPETVAAHAAKVTSVAAPTFLGAGPCVVTAAADGTAFVWHAGPAPRQVAALATEAQAVGLVGLSPKGDVALTAGRAGTAVRFRAHRLGPDCAPTAALDVHAPRTPLGNVLHVGTSVDRQEQPIAATFSPDGRWLLTGGRDGGAATLWAVGGEALLTRRAILEGHEYGVFALAFSADGRHLVTCGNEGDTRLWRFDPDTGAAEPVEYLAHAANPPAKFPTVAAWSPDGARLAILGGHYRTGRAWLYGVTP